VRGAEGLESGRAGFLAGLDEPGDVDAEPAAAQREHLAQRSEIDRVLALVVGGAAAVKALAVLRQRPRAGAAGPARILAVNHVAVAVYQHGRQGLGLVAAGDQERPGAGDRIRVDRRREAERVERGHKLVGEVGPQLLRRRWVLAFAADRDAAREFAREVAAHALMPTCRPA
jgi:hypothetical protein